MLRRFVKTFFVTLVFGLVLAALTFGLAFATPYLLDNLGPVITSAAGLVITALIFAAVDAVVG